jgi:hypothetical protein
VTTATPGTVLVAGDEALATFREGLTGGRGLELLSEARGRLLVQLPVGVGKSRFLAELAAAALDGGGHDLAVILAPLRAILDETVGRLPARLSPLVLRPRPRRRCGDLDGPWQAFERQGCTLLARSELCGACPRRRGCFWPGQLGEGLRGARLVLATQQHLALNPLFLLHVTQKTRARRPLLLVDESDLLVRPAERTLRRADLAAFLAAQESCVAAGTAPSACAEPWLNLTRLVADAATEDLREGRWRFPRVGARWAVEVQRRGRELHGDGFRFPAYDLVHFGTSDRASRERLGNGDLRYAALPHLGDSFVIFSGSIAPEFARFRMDPDHARPSLVSPFAGHRFEHPGTRWYNLRSAEGADCNFPNNAGRILGFFAALLARNIAAGRRTLLVCKKRFVRSCRKHLLEALKGLGEGGVRIVTEGWGRHDLQDPRTVAIINYGVSGINAFEHVEAAYCLTGYYVPADAVERAVHDLEPSPSRFPVSLRLTGTPKRREAVVELPPGVEPITPWLARQALLQKEGDVIAQAVGRVRPFTRPREVFTFYLGDLPGVRYAVEFASLRQARSYFGVPTRGEGKRERRRQEVRRLRALGHTLAEVAAALGASVATIKRDLREG